MQQGRRAARAAFWPYASPDDEIPGASVRINGRLIAAVTLVPAVTAAFVLYVPWRGSNMTMLIVGWILTLMGCGGLLAPRDQVRHLGWAAFIASVVYAGIVIVWATVLVSSLAGSEDF